MAQEMRNPQVDKLMRWVLSRVTQLMNDATRWEITITGKGAHFSCKYSVYEEP